MLLADPQASSVPVGSWDASFWQNYNDSPHLMSRLRGELRRQGPKLMFFADARRYFKQSEIVLYRQAPEEARALAMDAPGIGGKLPTPNPPIPA